MVIIHLKRSTFTWARVCFCACDGVSEMLRPPPAKKKEKKKKDVFHCWQFDGMKSSQGYNTVSNGCSSSAWLMRNRCYESLSNTVKLRLLSDSRGGWGGLIPVEAIVHFLTGRRRNRAVLFQLWLCDSCMTTRIVRGYVLFLMAETPLNSFVQHPEGKGKKKKKSTGNEQHDEKDAQAGFFFSCKAAYYESHCFKFAVFL